jgi:hypothetical protein
VDGGKRAEWRLKYGIRVYCDVVDQSSNFFSSLSTAGLGCSAEVRALRTGNEMKLFFSNDASPCESQDCTQSDAHALLRNKNRRRRNAAELTTRSVELPASAIVTRKNKWVDIVPVPADISVAELTNRSDAVAHSRSVLSVLEALVDSQRHLSTESAVAR